MVSEIEKSQPYQQAAIRQLNPSALPDQLKQLIGAHDALKQLAGGANSLDNSLAELKQTLTLYQGS